MDTQTAQHTEATEASHVYVTDLDAFLLSLEEDALAGNGKEVLYQTDYDVGGKPFTPTNMDEYHKFITNVTDH